MDHFPAFAGRIARVLLVEDNPDHTFLALSVLQQVLGDDSDIIVAENADEAIRIINQFTEHDRPDLMLIDLRLPREGGFGVLSAARGHHATAEVPVFVVTASIYDRDIAQSYLIGVSAVLTKPLTRAKLRAELRRIGALPAS